VDTRSGHSRRVYQKEDDQAPEKLKRAGVAVE
jgi:hypothetical protein